MTGFGKWPACAFAIAGFVLISSSTTSAQNSNRPQSLPAASPSRPRVANVSATNSFEGSRISVTSDQSLNNYEAYRSGDRFYVRIPPTDVRSPVARGRGFDNMKVVRTMDSTVLSFHLEPGATARVEQQGGQLSVVF